MSKVKRRPGNKSEWRKETWGKSADQQSYTALKGQKVLTVLFLILRIDLAEDIKVN